MRTLVDHLTDGGIKTLFSHLRWALGITWNTDKRLFSGLIVLTLIQSLMPAALALAARGLINSVAVVLANKAEDTSEILFWLVVGLLVTLTAEIATSLTRYLNQRLQDELNVRVTSDILDHAATLEYAHFEDPRFQDIMQRAQDQSAQHFAQAVAIVLRSATSLLQIATLVAILTAIEPLATLLLVPIGLYYLHFHWRYAQRRFAEAHARTTKQRWTSYFVQQLTTAQSVAEAKLLGLAPLFTRQFRALMAGFRDRDRDLYRFALVRNLAFAVLSVTAIYLGLGWATRRVISEGLTIGDIAIFGTAASRLRSAVESLIVDMGNLRWQALHLANLIEFFGIEPEEKTSGVPLPVPLRGEIEVRNVTFTYPGADQPTLHNISLHVKPGEIVALVGENGAGKTTLVKLLARLYDPPTGSILYDGMDLRHLSREELHRSIAFVFQDFGRYSATAADNIAYGDWQSLLNQPEEIRRITTKAGIHEMIDALPQGYDTMLGRVFGDHTLSGGQWQRIAITRAFARDASLLILDEPTASLDSRAEYELFDRFRELAHGRTTILISHRFSTVSMADRIVVMNEGRIVEVGTHDELTSLAGHYAMLYDLHQRQMTGSASPSGSV